MVDYIEALGFSDDDAASYESFKQNFYFNKKMSKFWNETKQEIGAKSEADVLKYLMLQCHKHKNGCGQADRIPEKKIKGVKGDREVLPSVASETTIENMTMEAMTAPREKIRSELEKLVERQKPLKAMTKRFGGAHDLNAKEDVMTLMLLPHSDVPEMKFFTDWWFDVIRWTRAAMYNHIPVSKRLMKMYDDANDMFISNDIKKAAHTWLARKQRQDSERYGRRIDDRKVGHSQMFRDGNV